MRITKKIMSNQLHTTRYELDKLERALINHDVKITPKDLDCLYRIVGFKKEDLEAYLEQEGLLEE